MIGEIIPWHDPRSGVEAAWLEARVGAGPLFATTGLRVGPKCSLAKLLWLARHRPAAIRRAVAWAGVAELVGHALTGRLATNASLACRTLAFDLRTGAWSDDLLDLAGFSAARMPQVVPLGAAAGGLLPGVAADLGLPSGMPVAVAGHDHLVGALGAGVVEPGMALDSIGSAEACLVVTERPRPLDALRAAGFSVGRHPVDGLGYVMAGLQSAGRVVEWFIDAFLGEVHAPERYARMLRLLDQAPARPGSLVVLPYLQGRTAPQPDLGARLAVTGIEPGHGLSEMAAATIDGLACAAAWILNEVERTARLRVRELRVIGGGARIPRWLEAKAALAGRPVCAVETEEAAALGSALVGGLAGGVYGSIGEALQVAGPSRPVPAPPRGSTEAYRRYYRPRFLPAATRDLDLPSS